MNTINDSTTLIIILAFSFVLLLVSEVVRLRKEQKRLNNKIRYLRKDIDKLSGKN